MVMGFIEQQTQFVVQDQQERAASRTFLEHMRADWGGRMLWYHGPLLSIGSYVPTSGKLSVVSVAGPLLFLPKSIQVFVLEIDDDGWVKLIIGFDRQDQPVYRYVKAGVLQKYAEIVERQKAL